MQPRPKSVASNHLGCGKLRDRVALITGGDSGIGRAVAVLFAKEGADVAVVYFNEHKDARETERLVESQGRKCLLIPGDIGLKKFCQSAVKQTKRDLGEDRHPRKQRRRAASTGEHHEDCGEAARKDNSYQYFRNVFSREGGDAAFQKRRRDNQHDVRHGLQGQSRAARLFRNERRDRRFHPFALAGVGGKEIRVNAVAPGPIWTPLIPSTFPAKEVATFGSDTPLGRAGEPEEAATSFVFLASDDSSYMTGQVLHPNGGRVVNG